jgi:hypothetical protein
LQALQIRIYHECPQPLRRTFQKVICYKYMYYVRRKYSENVEQLF